MDKQNNQQSASAKPNNVVVSLIKRLEQYEQNAIECVRTQEHMFKIIRDSIKNNTDELKSLELSLIQCCEDNESLDVCKENLLKTINNLRELSQDAEQAIYDTVTTLLKIKNLKTISENKVQEKQGHLEKEKMFLMKEVEDLQDKFKTMKSSYVNEENEYKIILGKVKTENDKNEEFSKTEEGEIRFLETEISEQEKLLVLNETALDEIRTCVVNIQSEIDEFNIQKSNLEENINHNKTILDEHKLNLEESIEEEINLNNCLQKLKGEVFTIEEENAKLKTHEVFELIVKEEHIYNEKERDFTQKINEVKENNHVLDFKLSEERNVMDKLSEEYSKLENDIEANNQMLSDLINQIEIHKNDNTSELITLCKEKTKSTLDTLLATTAEVNKLKDRVLELEQTVSNMPSITDEEIFMVKEEISNVNKAVEESCLHMEMDSKEWKNKHERLKEEMQNETAEKVKSLQQLKEEINTKIEEVTKIEKTANITLQANKVEYDIFTKKLKDIIEIRHNLKQQIKSLQKPVQRKKRNVDEMSDTSETDAILNTFTSAKDIQKYIMSKKRAG